jgi:hypothetical protein
MNHPIGLMANGAFRQQKSRITLFAGNPAIKQTRGFPYPSWTGLAFTDQAITVIRIPVMNGVMPVNPSRTATQKSTPPRTKKW